MSLKDRRTVPILEYQFFYKIFFSFIKIDAVNLSRTLLWVFPLEKVWCESDLRPSGEVSFRVHQKDLPK